MSNQWAPLIAQVPFKAVRSSKYALHDSGSPDTVGRSGFPTALLRSWSVGRSAFSESGCSFKMRVGRSENPSRGCCVGTGRSVGREKKLQIKVVPRGSTNSLIVGDNTARVRRQDKRFHQFFRHMFEYRAQPVRSREESGFIARIII